MGVTLVGIGEICWDLLPGGRQLGGAPANFACHAHGLGQTGIVVSRVGRDEMGREIVARLDDLGLGAAYITLDAQRPTGTVSVRLDEAGVPAFGIHTCVAWDALAISPELMSLAAGVDVVCFGSLAQRSLVSRQAVQSFLRACPGESLRIFDINLRQADYSKDAIEESLHLANVLKLNDAELLVVADVFQRQGDEQDVMRALAERFGLKVVALTRGSQGSLLYSDDAFADHPGVDVEVVDTVGAGDAFTAAMAIGFLRGWDLETINARANRVAAFVCTMPGATPEMPEGIRELFEG